MSQTVLGDGELDKIAAGVLLSGDTDRGSGLTYRGHVDFRIFTEPQQGADYDQLLAVATRPRISDSMRSSGRIISWRWAMPTAYPARRTRG